jgi:hypothetical protein
MIGQFDPKQLENEKKPEAQIRVNLNDAKAVVCEECGNQTFDAVLLIKKVSAILSPTGKEEVIPIQTLACYKCGHINKEFLPGA